MQADSNKTRGNSFKLKGKRFRLDIGKKVFPVKVGGPWHRLPKEAVVAPLLAVSMARLDRAWSLLV